MNKRVEAFIGEPPVVMLESKKPPYQDNMEGSGWMSD